MRIQSFLKYARRKKVGDLLEFGRYLLPTGCKPYPYDIKVFHTMKWYVLSKEGSRMLLLSKDCIDWDFMDGTGWPQTWEHSYMRKKILPELMEQMFNEEEKKLILEVPLQTGDNPSFGTKGGNDTTDKIFLLSLEEFDRYVSPTIAVSEMHFFEQDLKNENEYEIYHVPHEWWLRTPGLEQSDFVLVYSDGIADPAGLDNGSDEIGIRPAVWIDLGPAEEEPKQENRDYVVPPDYDDEDLPF